MQNVTDVDDPLLERATATGVDWRDLAASQTELFREDMTALRVLPPAHYVGAVEAIPLDRRVHRGTAGPGRDLRPRRATCTSRSTPTRSFGSVARLDRTAMLDLFGKRGGDPQRPGKKDPLDALLWRAQRPDEPCWSSPAGPGRPGWHVECTAIALDRLGEHVDVHGRRAATWLSRTTRWALRTRTRAPGMPRSSGSSCTPGWSATRGRRCPSRWATWSSSPRCARAGVDPGAIRLALLGHHYAADWEWTDADLSAAVERLARWRAAVSRPDGPSAESTLATRAHGAGRDLDAPAALAAVDEWAARARTGEGVDAGAPGVISRLVDGLLGVAL